ncbi:ADP-ribose pyrophosphatase YjhB (NUDIX family) [Kribbella voronezhensis]|uniref:ADP-ribose pyrophosphatase YjhB (NUDIX family) n=1 Tax=Kribbella voronezhensis TaxID=2512212 RepID=A0A4R7T5Q2_9ACTN|nr:NUDIX hydrolase [Kribbella voronezhensis]TDU86889.1 ADP-ribose pyrophosphatase YjhB (NUDIX family) [Kribbella voronezhensis]
MNRHAAPVHRAAVGVLITDLDGRVLLVSNPYRKELVQVGGMVEAGQSLADAAERETFEEIGLKLTVTRLLAVHYRPGITDADTILYVFDTDPIDASTPLVLQDDEITAAFWLEPSDAIGQHSARGRARLAAALKARAANTTIYLDANRTL